MALFRNLRQHARSPLFWAAGSLLLFLLIWHSQTLGSRDRFFWPPRHWATFIGVAGFYLFSLSLLLSSRWSKLEDWFGGLDLLYQAHRKIGIWGFVLILIHPWAEAIRWLPEHPERLFVFTLPIHGRLSLDLGALAYWLTLIILGFTFLKLLPYHRWKILHKFMSLAFILASLHVVLSQRRVGSEIAQVMLYLPIGVGLLAIFYKQVYLEFFAKKQKFSVVAVNHLNENITEVLITPLESSFRAIPGQYGFFSFKSKSLSLESHPFTLIGPLEGKNLSILVKARGDYTVDFCRNIATGDIAAFEGPHGRLDYTLAGNLQLWIAGGIGVVLFLAWLRNMKREPDCDRTIDFYYCVHRRRDAVFYDEFQEFGRGHPNFRTFLHCTEEGSRLDIEKIKAASKSLSQMQIFMCGPIKLTDHFNRQFQNLGISQQDIFFENFEFF